MEFNENLNKNADFFIGIDQSINSTGITILNSKKKIILSRVVSSNKELPFEIRISRLVDNILEIVEQFDNCQITIEGLAFARNQNFNNGALLYGLFTTLLIELTKKYISYLVLPPTSLKKFATGSGRATKKDIINSISDEDISLLSLLSNKKPSSKSFEDIADSYYLAKYALKQTLKTN